MLPDRLEHGGCGAIITSGKPHSFGVKVLGLYRKRSGAMSFLARGEI